MQEDKTSKWLAASLRKQQEENPLPYELGAWEAFEAKRAAIARKNTTYWLSGIAAALTLLLVAGGLWLSQQTENENTQLTEQIAFEEKLTTETPEIEDQMISEAEIPNEGDGDLSKSQVLSSAEKQASKNQNPSQVSNLFNPTNPKINSDSQIARLEDKQVLIEKASPNVVTPQPEVMNSLIATQEKPMESNESKVLIPEKVVAPEALPKEPQLSEEEIVEILESEKSFATLAMGVSPGFGASQGSDQTTSGSSLGLGVMVNMEITGKLVMGSGLAVNYLNQSSESQSYNYGGANALAAKVTETNEISQVQVDIPLYFNYPITRNRAISVQAGFSNLITFNQGAEQQSSYTRQVAVMDGLAANSAFTLRSESVSQSQDLSVPNQKFYPLATANLGVNIRLYESKKTSYEVMPFYNYPLQEFSGYGEKLGMFGASFKVNFGAIEKK
ncbi:MAG TPA: hypothetical protein VLA71_04885 [Algoriphagus sp.]|nr:hypothetical protein [Algoriphagus sp.]